jgi:hypothetical protein
MMKDAQLISVVIEGIRFRICMSPLVSASALCLVMKGVQAILCIHPLFTVMMKGAQLICVSAFCLVMKVCLCIDPFLV